MKPNSNLKSDIGSHTTHEIGIPKYYSKRTSVMCLKIDPELKSEFKATCKLRGVSICHVTEALFKAWIEGQKATATVIKPVIVNLNMQHIVKRPRREQSFEDMMFQIRQKNWPPPCKKADRFIKSMKEVGCLEIKDFIKLEKCWRCFYNGARA